MASSLFDSNTDPLAALVTDTSGQRSQIAQYSIMRAATYLQNNNNDAALKEFKKALAFDSKNTTALTYIGKINLAKGDNLEAIKAFKTMVQYQPGSADAHVNLANAYMQDKQYTASEKEFKTAERLDPTNPLPSYTLGLQYVNTNRLNEAEAQFKKAQKISPADGNVYYALGMLNNKQGKFEDAAVNLQKALFLKNDFPAATYELGVAYNALGKTEDAQKQLAILQNSGASQAKDLQFQIEKPQMLYIDSQNNKNFNEILGPGTPLWMLDTSLFTPSAGKQVSVAIQFNNEMDPSSVMNVANWSISRANNTEGGYYLPNNTGREASIPLTPTLVSYDPATLQANVTFTLHQNAAGNATIDPSHLVFKFSGTDAAGRQMDTAADEIDGSAENPF